MENGMALASPPQSDRLSPTSSREGHALCPTMASVLNRTLRALDGQCQGSENGMMAFLPPAPPPSDPSLPPSPHSPPSPPPSPRPLYLRLSLKDTRPQPQRRSHTRTRTRTRAHTISPLPTHGKGTRPQRRADGAGDVRQLPVQALEPAVHLRRVTPLWGQSGVTPVWPPLWVLGGICAGDAT